MVAAFFWCAFRFLARSGFGSQSVDFRMERLLDRSLQMETARGRLVDADFALESALLAKEEMIKQLAGFVLTNTNEILRSTLNLLR